MNLQLFIKDYRLSQRELADILECATGHMSNIVNGKRNLTGLQIRLLIDHFGYYVIAKYADPGEMPVAPVQSVNINMPKISGNSAPVQHGENNSLSNDEALVALLQKQTEMLAKRDEQIDRLISLLEQQQKSK